jgi:hypothetical protein
MVAAAAVPSNRWSFPAVSRPMSCQPPTGLWMAYQTIGHRNRSFDRLAHGTLRATWATTTNMPFGLALHQNGSDAPRMGHPPPPRLLHSQASGTRLTDPKRALGCRGQEGLPGPGSRLADRMGGMGREAKQARALSRVAWVVRLNRPEPHRGPLQNFTLELFRSCKLHIFLCKILIIDIFVV